MKKSEFRNLIKEEIKSILKEDLTTAKKGRRFIPQIVSLPIDVKNQFKEHFKLLKGGDGSYKLYISPMFKASLEQINRGRTGQDYLKKTPELVKKITDKIPQDIKGLLKKKDLHKDNKQVLLDELNFRLNEKNLIDVWQNDELINSKRIDNLSNKDLDKVLNILNKI